MSKLQYKGTLPINGADIISNTATKAYVDSVNKQVYGGGTTGNWDSKYCEEKANYKLDRSLGEELNKHITSLAKDLEKFRKSKQQIDDLEQKFKEKDVVFHKKLGPCIFKKFKIQSMAENPFGVISEVEICMGDILALVMTVDGPETVLAKEIAPYTESIKLLYESERDTVKE